MSKKRKVITLCVILVAVALLAGAGFSAYRYFSDPITYTVRDTLPDGEGKRARVILLGGQSNAVGCSRDEYLREKVPEEQYAEYANGYDHIYINYLSGENRSEGFVKCSVAQGEKGGFFGPELGLAEMLNELYPNETFFIIKCAWGGTNLYEQWLSPSSDGRTGELYRSFIAFVESSIDYLTDKNYDVSIEGMCWMQGESDSFSITTANEYAEHLEFFIKDVRNAFSEYAAEDGIAFIDATIAENSPYWVYFDAVNRSKAAVAERSPLNCLVDTRELSVAEEPKEEPDLAHYDSLSELRLGHLFGEGLRAYLQ